MVRRPTMSAVIVTRRKHRRPRGYAPPTVIAFRGTGLAEGPVAVRCA